MKCNWIGKTPDVSDTASRWVLVVKTPPSIPSEHVHNIAAMLGIPPMDISVKLSGDSFEFLSKSGDARSLGAMAKTLKEIGFEPFIFDNHQFFDVPDPQSFRKCEMAGDAVVFSSEGKTTHTINSDSRLFVCMAKMSMSKSNHIVHTFSGAGGPESGISLGEQMVHIVTNIDNRVRYNYVVDIYDFSTDKCTRIVEDRFNFRDLLKINMTYQFRANLNQLFEIFRKTVREIEIDERFSSSSLPFSGATVTNNPVRGTGIAGSPVLERKAEISSSSDTKFGQYSIFRYIVEKRRLQNQNHI